MADPQYRTIRYDVDGHVATVTLHRPAQLNAFTLEMMDELLDVFDRTDADDDVRAVIVTGEGRGFCAGADLSGGEQTFDYSRRAASETLAPPERGVPRDGGGKVSLRIYASTKPVIGAINGPAVGVGVTMTLPMDVRLASETARFGFVFSRRGIVPEACSSWFLPRLVGISQAAEWVYTGRVFDAAEARRGGLVRSVHAPDELLPAARALAVEMAEAAPVSVAMARQMMWRMLGAAHPMEAHRMDSRAMAWRGASADTREGINSFLDKRPPVFTDRVSEGWPDITPWWSEPEFS